MRLPRVGLSSLVLQVAVDVQRLVELGKAYPWPRPARCLSCNSFRIWGHGYARRYFEGLSLPAWVRRLRCPDCGTVYTLRPDLFYQRFRYAIPTILSSLFAKITNDHWLLPVPRQNQQYWLSGLKLQSMRLQNVLQLSMDTLKDVVRSGFIPASHSFKCAILRL